MTSCFQLAVSPTGHLQAIEQTVEDDSVFGKHGGTAERVGLDRSIADLFAANPSAGLFALATEQHEQPNAAASYWRDFAGRYLTELCKLPAVAADLGKEIPPPREELPQLLVNVPPMPGAEYLSESALTGIWTDLDAWARKAAASHKDGLTGFLHERAGQWRQVGRVCFHLAENRRDQDYPFAFLATYAPRLTTSARVQYQPLSDALREYAGAKNKEGLIKLLSPVQLAAEKSALVKELVDSGDIYQPLAWTPPDAYRFLKEIPALEECGILARVPDWWKKRPRPRVSVTIGDRKQNTLDLSALLDFRVRLALGDEQLSEAEWRALLAADDGLVLLKGQWVEVDRKRLNEALQHWQEVERQAEDGLSFVEGMRLLAGAPADLADAGEEVQEREWSFVQGGKWLGQLLKDLRSPEHLKTTNTSHCLKATLRPYQQSGVAWLSLLAQLGLGACLADDMGLGKTIQVLALMVSLPHSADRQPSLLVVPASLLGNWRSEIERFAPTLRVCFVHPAETPSEELERLAKQPKKAFHEFDVVLTTYAMLQRHDWLLTVDWRLAVIDEAQAIKNPAAKQTKAVKQVRSQARIALTGTPIENRLSDLWSLFDFLCPGLLGTQQKFKSFIKALSTRQEQRYAPLRKLVQPYILRRLKTDKQVISDLPDKTEVRAFCGLSKRQVVMYARLVDEMRQSLKNLDGMRRRGLVLAYLMKFKQVCNHPSQLLGDEKYAADDSGKFGRLTEIAEEIASRQEKALVFTQFRELTEPLATLLAGIFGRPGLVLHGGTAVKRRKTLVDQFQPESGPPFFVLSLKAGGTGLNLTQASHVIHFDRWWNPAVENQATDRAFRIGQHRNVLVHKFVCRGTIEERIDELIAEKSQLSAELLEGGAEQMLTEMSDAELIRLVSLDVNRAGQ